jgi:hypothetical protein
LLKDLQDWFDPKVELLPGMGSPPKDFRSSTLTSKGHGTIEVRTLTTSSQLNDFLDWPFLQQVFQLERCVTISKTGRMRHEIVYSITSLAAELASPHQLLQMLRSYWKIENCLHYTAPAVGAGVRVMLLCMKTKPGLRRRPLPISWRSLTISLLLSLPIPTSSLFLLLGAISLLTPMLLSISYFEKALADAQGYLVF